MTQTDMGQNSGAAPGQAVHTAQAEAEARQQRRQEELERIRRRRRRTGDHQRLRQTLNMIFLLLAAVGLALYFCSDSYHIAALAVIGAGMLFKVGEFFVRFFM